VSNQSPLSRAEMARRMLAHRAAADAFEKALKDGAENEYREQGTVPSWKIPDVATVSGNMTADALTVSDEAAFLNWLAVNLPAEVEEVPATRRIRNPTSLLAALRDVLEAADADELEPGGQTFLVHPKTAEIVPGLLFTRGGRWKHASIKPDARLLRRMAICARLHVEQGISMVNVGPLPLPEAVSTDGASSDLPDAGEPGDTTAAA
jgi:hypothetical protein